MTASHLHVPVHVPCIFCACVCVLRRQTCGIYVSVAAVANIIHTDARVATNGVGCMRGVMRFVWLWVPFRDLCDLYRLIMAAMKSYSR